MKCFHFTNGETTDDEINDENNVVVSRGSSKLSWARSLSVASSSSTTTTATTTTTESRRRRDMDFNTITDSGFGIYEFLAHKRIKGNDLKVFNFAELKKATRGFSRALLIGEGGFGCVYRGVVSCGVAESGSDDQLDVAVKQLDRNGFQGHKEWINEVNFLGVVNHPNLVKLVGYCAEDDERGIQRLLVYELMRNKSLEDHLLVRAPSPLSWMARLKIAQDAARGLAYLHEEMAFQLIFRDFKASNILLDENFNAKLSDFGLAKPGPAAGLSHVLTSVVGTVGYAAPEYVQTGRLTVKSDVWSFGVVLYELITGRRAVERNLPRSEQKLLVWVRRYVSDPKKFHLIMDPQLDGQYCIRSARKLASLANKCLLKRPKSRPKMSEVVEKLGNIISQISSQDNHFPEHVKETEYTNEEVLEEVGTSKLGDNDRKRVFDFRDMVGLRNRSIGKLDWGNWKPGLVRTW